MSIKITPLKSTHHDILQRFLDKVPEGGFYLKSDVILPLRYEKTPFLLEVSEPGVPLFFTVSKVRLDGSDRISETILIHPNKTSTVFLQLAQGRNLVHVTSAIGTAELIVVSSYFATLFSSLAEEIFEHTDLKLTELKSSLFSRTSSRIAEHFFRFSNILPEANMPRRLSSRMALGAFFGYPASEAGISRLISASTINTPVLRETLVSRDTFDPIPFPLYRSQEDFGGFEADIWLPDPCGTNWYLFLKLLSSSSSGVDCLVTKASEDEVVLSSGDFHERHQARGVLEEDCSLEDLLPDCFDKIRVSVGLKVVSSFAFCFTAYSFDEEVTQCGALGARYLDCGREFDLDISLDKGDEAWDLEGTLVDPFSDGFLGFGLSNRFDAQVGIP